MADDLHIKLMHEFAKKIAIKNEKNEYLKDYFWDIEHPFNHYQFAGQVDIFDSWKLNGQRILRIIEVDNLYNAGEFLRKLKIKLQYFPKELTKDIGKKFQVIKPYLIIPEKKYVIDKISTYVELFNKIPNLSLMIYSENMEDFIHFRFDELYKRRFGMYYYIKRSIEFYAEVKQTILEKKKRGLDKLL